MNVTCALALGFAAGLLFSFVLVSLLALRILSNFVSDVGVGARSSCR